MQPVAPTLKIGYNHRHLTPNDVPAAYEVMKAYYIELLGSYGGTLDGIRTSWESPGFDLSKDSQGIFDHAGKLVAFTTVWNTSAPYAQAYIFVPVHPDSRAMGFGTFLSQWAEQRVKEIGEKAPDHIQLSIACDALKSDNATIELLENLDYIHVRNYFTMKIFLDKEVPKPQFPSHIQLLTLEDYHDIPRMARAVAEAFEDHWGSVKRDEDDMIRSWEYRTSIEGNPNFDASLWFLAMDGDEIAGMCFCVENWHEFPDSAYITTVGVRPAWRRQGIAKALLHHCFRVIQARGKPAVALDVDATSLTGANRLYESAGMHVFRQWMGYEKTIRDGEDIRTKTLED